jgi:hypothetical protein
VSESLFPTIRLVLQPDRRQRSERRSMWRGGRRSTDAPQSLNRQSSDWADGDGELTDAELVSSVH